jgi:hypothetical protein
MFRKIIRWFKDRKEKKKLEKRFKEKMKKLKDRDPFFYKH